MATALLLAAGLGERLGLGRPKALAELAGRPLWRWSADVLLGCSEISPVVLAVPAGGGGEAFAEAVREDGTLAAAVAPPRREEGSLASSGREQAPAPGIVPASASGELIVVPGGAVRSQSVRLALAAAGEGDEDSLVLVHDAARPLLTVEVVRATLAAASREGVDAAIAATPVTDTIKQADGDGRVLSTLERDGLWAVQTPQVFRRGALVRALDVGADVLAQATDDAWLIERMGGSVAVVPAPRENLKVTTPLDLELAELLLARRGPASGV